MVLLPGDTPKRTRFKLLSVSPRGTAGQGSEPKVGSGLDVPFIVQVPTTQTVNAFEIQSALGVVLGGLSSKQVTLTAAQILALNTTPVAVIPAPGAGKVILVKSCVVQLVFNSVQFASGGVVSPVYHGATTNLLSGGVAAATINGGANATVSCGAPAAALVLTPNVGVDIFAATGNFTTGNSTAVVTMQYVIMAGG